MTLHTKNAKPMAVIIVSSIYWVMQDSYHQPYERMDIGCHVGVYGSYIGCSSDHTRNVPKEYKCLWCQRIPIPFDIGMMIMIIIAVVIISITLIDITELQP